MTINSAHLPSSRFILHLFHAIIIIIIIRFFCLCHLLSPFFSLYYFSLILDPSGASLYAQSFKQNQNAVDFQKISEVSQIVFQQEIKLSWTFHTYKCASKQSLSRQRWGRKPDSSSTRRWGPSVASQRASKSIKCFVQYAAFPQFLSSCDQSWFTEQPRNCLNDSKPFPAPPRRLDATCSSVYLWDFFLFFHNPDWNRSAGSQTRHPLPLANPPTVILSLAALADDHQQVLEARWTNAFLQMTARQGKIEFSLPSICACGWSGRGWGWGGK